MKRSLVIEVAKLARRGRLSLELSLGVLERVLSLIPITTSCLCCLLVLLLLLHLCELLCLSLYSQCLLLLPLLLLPLLLLDPFSLSNLLLTLFDPLLVLIVKVTLAPRFHPDNEDLIFLLHHCPGSRKVVGVQYYFSPAVHYKTLLYLREEGARTSI